MSCGRCTNGLAPSADGLGFCDCAAGRRAWDRALWIAFGRVQTDLQEAAQ